MYSMLNYLLLYATALIEYQQNLKQCQYNRIVVVGTVI